MQQVCLQAFNPACAATIRVCRSACRLAMIHLSRLRTAAERRLLAMLGSAQTRLPVRGHGAAAAAGTAGGVEQAPVQGGLVAGADIGCQQQHLAGKGQLEIQVVRLPEPCPAGHISSALSESAHSSALQRAVRTMLVRIAESFAGPCSGDRSLYTHCAHIQYGSCQRPWPSLISSVSAEDASF